MPDLEWMSASTISPAQYTCGHCGKLVGPSTGYWARAPSGHPAGALIYICSYCRQPTYIFGSRQVPGVAYGNDVGSLPEDIDKLYREARDACSIGAYTASVLACRKILMNIAVAQGATEGKSFVSYIEYLAQNGYVPPHGEGWVDHIRRRGNEATHEIALMAQTDAEELISFVEMLLKFVYEFPARVPSTP